MKKYIITFLFLLLSFVSFAQRDLSPLFAKLENTESEEAKVNILLEIADEMAYDKAEEAIKYAESAIVIAKRLKNDKGLIQGKQVIAKAYKNKKKYTFSLANYVEAVRLAENLNDPNLLGDVYFDMALLYQAWNVPDKALEHFNKAARSKKVPKGSDWENRTLANISALHLQMNNQEKAKENYLKLLSNYRASGSDSKITTILYRLINIHITLREYKKALTYNHELLELRKKTGEDIRGTLNTMGFLYKQANDYQKALRYFKQALAENRKTSGKEVENVKVLTNIGVMQQYLGNHDQALTTFKETLDILEREKKEKEIANLCLYITALYVGRKDYSKSLEYVARAIKIGEAIKSNRLLSRAYQREADIHELMGHKAKSLESYKKYISVKEKAIQEQLNKEREDAQKYKVADDKEKELKEALVETEVQAMRAKQREIELVQKDKDLALIRSEKTLLEKNENLSRIQLNADAADRAKAENDLLFAQQEIETSKKDREISDLQKNQEMQDLALSKQQLQEKERERDLKLLEQEKELQAIKLKDEKDLRNYFYAVIGLFGLMIIGAIIGLYFRNKANKQLASQFKEIARQNQEAAKKNEIILKTNEKITSSINYAQTIQQAILPTGRNMQEALDDFFVIYRPKDIVSGDFYWFSHIKSKQEGEADKVFVAVADCTGHGVPGAFMSMIGNTLFNEIVNHESIYQPAEVLTLLNERTQIALKQNSKSGESSNQDGMDVCLCLLERVNHSQTKVTFAGAKRPLYVYKGAEFTEMKGDRKCIGGFQKGVVDFTDNEFILDNGSVLYLTTDGFADQNDPNRRKIGSRRLKKMLSDNAHLLLFRQKLALENVLDGHKQDSDQRDDITIVGIKL
jgi:serine phosphatase RsbU (regulator of sigma subunit)/tetratricopeptide (TPR) repeat protein